MLSIIVFSVIIAYVNSQPGSVQSVVAFSKGQTSHLHITKGDTIIYNANITSIGATFNNNNEFVCQTPGLYVFTFYSLTRSDGELWLELMKNDQLVGSVYAYTYADYADAGNSAVLNLVAGDRVYIKAHDNYDNSLFGQKDEIYATFTGELILANNAEIPSPNSIGPVGFTVALSNNVSISDGGQVMYDYPITNVGSGYNLNTGNFTAPIDGTYVFQFHAVAKSSEEFWLELFHNDQYVCSSYGYTSGSYADSGNSVAIHLTKGDHVTIKARPGHSVELYGDSDELYTTFSGYLLSPAVSGTNPGSSSQQEIAFSVGLSHNFASSNGDKVKFDRVFVNLGQQYDVNTGVFTAPISGIYSFHYHILAQKSQEVWVELYHNYKYINTAYGHTSGSYGVGSNAATLHLTQGDTVYLDIAHHDSQIYGAVDEVYGTFTGYLLAPLADYHPVIG